MSQEEHDIKMQHLASVLETALAAETSGDYDEAERLAAEVLSATDPENISELEHHIHALLRLGNVARVRGNYPGSLEKANAALVLSEKFSNKPGIAKASGLIGIVYGILSDYPPALEYLGKALNTDEELGNKKGMATHMGNIGTVLWERSNFPSALEYFGKALSINEELGNKAGVAAQLGNIGNGHARLSDYPRALEYFGRALGIHEELGYKAGAANILGNIGSMYGKLSDYPRALEYFGRALGIHEELGIKKGVAENLGNIGSIHALLSDSRHALEYIGKSLRINEELGNKIGVIRNLSNIGAVQMSLNDYPRALEFSGKALNLAEELGDKHGIALCLKNLGEVYEKQQEYHRALEYYNRSVQLRDEIGGRDSAANTRGAIGSLYANAQWAGYDETKAEEYLLESIAVSEELGTKNYEALKALSDLYKRQKRWEECHAQFEKFYTLEKEVQSEEAKKSAILMEQKKQIAEREKEIAIAKAAADAQMSATTGLLYKVLPESIATRIIDGEEEIADYFTSVSILFADISGFTPISADMPAIMVVRFLNFVFGEFDRIIKKHGCEKIKTIGDGYMAVSGAPQICEDHAERLAAAALEMQQRITLPEAIREYMPDGTKFGVRIGLHTGSIVAGVIGEERFVYDIYSDAVNTAARMESHGEENKIHVSNDFYRHLQNRFAMTKNTSHGLTFVKRGEIEIKGKGMMRTYYVEKAP